MQRVGFSTASDVIPELEYLSNYSVPVIPGIPDDVALHCLLRLPECCRAVCKRWNDVLGNKQVFFRLRKRLGFKDPWLLVIDSPKHIIEENQCQVLDLTNMCWHTVSPMPSPHKVSPYSLQCVSICGEDEDVVYVCGDEGLVSKFEIQNNRWSEMKRMNSKRSYCACGVMNGMIYVGGGLDGHDPIDSAEVLDPAKGSWRPIATMGRPTVSFDSAIFDGKLHSWSWSFQLLDASVRVHVYDPTNDKWEICTSVGLTQQLWKGRSAVVYGHLFGFFEVEKQARKLKVYKSDNDSWEEVEGPPLPKLISRYFVVNGCDNKAGGILCVVGEHLHVVVGYISILNKNQAGSSSSKFSVRWQQIPAPKGLSNLTPRSCQLLYA